MEILSFRKGRLLYRGPPSDRQKDIFGYYFSVDDLACWHADSRYNGKIYKFKTKQSLKLVDFSETKTFEYLYNTLKDKNLELFKIATGYGLTQLYHHGKEEVYCYYKNKPKFEPRLCLVGQHEEGDIDYTNLKFMKLICKLGYDGIRMPSKYIEQHPRDKKTFDAVYRFFNKHEESIYNEDYFICNSKDVLEVIESYYVEDAPICKKYMTEDNNADT